jgi:uncharacterized membrane protein YhaH (DUF805 family)
MQAQTNLPRPRYWAPIPLWGRVGMACLMFLFAALNMAKHLLRFEWISWLCFGLFWLVYTPRQLRETSRTYLKKPKAIAMALLLIVAIVGSVHNLYGRFTK